MALGNSSGLQNFILFSLFLFLSHNKFIHINFFPSFTHEPGMYVFMYECM